MSTLCPLDECFGHRDEMPLTIIQHADAYEGVE